MCLRHEANLVFKSHCKIRKYPFKISIFAKNFIVMNELFTIAGHFVDAKAIEEIAPLGNGLINDTFKIVVDGKPQYVLQRINNAVFTDVEMLPCDGFHFRQLYL